MAVSFAHVPIGSSWSRPRLAKLWGYAGFQALARGVVTPAGDNKIILFVTEEKQRSATTYADLLREDILEWEGPNDHFAEDRMLRAQLTNDQLFLFYRQRHHTDFKYRGELKLLRHRPRSDAPSKFVFEVLDAERGSWTTEQLQTAFFLYLQTKPNEVSEDAEPIARLAAGLRKSRQAVAAKLRTLAQLDPMLMTRDDRASHNITGTDEAVWEGFKHDWTAATLSAARAFEATVGDYWDKISATHMGADDSEYLFKEGRSAEAIVQVRRDQYLFRRAVLSSYGATCCMSGLNQERLLIASHIVPWSADKKNRLNPANGLCLSVLHDRAYDQGMLTVLPDFTVKIREELLQMKSEELAGVFRKNEGRKIRLPGRFPPQADFLLDHAKRFGFM
jgi:putative restriction endonuclease